MCKIPFTILAGIAIVLNLSAQEGIGAYMEKSDSLSSEEILFTPNSASNYIVDLLNMEFLWRPGSDSIKIPLKRLIDQYNETYDSIENRLSKIDYNPVSFRKVDTLQNDTLNLRWLNDSTFIIDTLELGKEPLFVQKTVVKKIIDSFELANDSIMATGYPSDSIIRKRDTIVSKKDIVVEVMIDTALIKSKNLQLYKIKDRRIVPGIFPAGSNKSYRFIYNGSKLIVSEPVQVIVANQDSPFNIVPNEKIPDSLNIAVQTLLSYIDQRDSIQVYLNTIEGLSTPFWLTLRDDELQRYWVKNQKNDSVSIWMGNPDKRNITLILEDDINIERITKDIVDDVPFTMSLPQIKLVNVEPFKEIPVYWDYDFSSSFSLSENYFSNWAKGGESSLSSLVDIKGQAKYTNKEAKTEWTSSGRLKYGSIITEEDNEWKPRKNTDMLELDSKFNKALRKKTDFSTLFHMKNQIAKGYNYPNDSIPVSKFLNPGTFTIGVGLEYKPFKKSTVNFSILSYKNTFVLDTVTYPQTNHGVDKGKRAKQEMGGQLLINNEVTLLEDMKINSSMRLFSNYLEKPENIDIEWELNLEKQISLYFTILLNIHLIYDDDILLPVLDENKKPVILPDGTEKKAPQLQFKQFLGLTFLIKL